MVLFELILGYIVDRYVIISIYNLYSIVSTQLIYFNSLNNLLKETFFRSVT